MFHIAAKFNSLDVMQLIVKQQIFFEELLVKDYRGNTPIHLAAVNGSFDILDFFLDNSTSRFLEY